MSDPTPIAREPDEAQARGPATPADFARYRPTCAECGAPVVLGDESSCTFHGDALCCLACAGRGEPQTTPPAEPAEERPVPETKTSETISTPATWPTGSCGHKVRPPKTGTDACRKCELKAQAVERQAARAAAGAKTRGPMPHAHRMAISRAVQAKADAKRAARPVALPDVRSLPVPYLMACRDELARRARDAREVLRALGEAA